MIKKRILNPERIRRIDGGFSFITNATTVNWLDTIGCCADTTPIKESLSPTILCSVMKIRSWLMLLCNLQIWNSSPLKIITFRQLPKWLTWCCQPQIGLNAM